jgi:hypothetical protein
MLRDPLPESEAFRALLADLHDDLPARVERHRLLWCWESDRYGGGQLMIPGGHTAYMAYVELRHAFICGNFISTVLLAQCLVENVLASHVGMDALSAEIHQRSYETLRDRPTARECIAACWRLGVLDATDERDLLRLADARNSLAHFRPVSDDTNLDKRALNDRRHAVLVCYEDVRFAMGLVVRIMSKPAFLVGGAPGREPFVT